MAFKYESMEALAHKADWEGGWAEFILSYGLDVSQLPSDAPDGLADVVASLQVEWEELMDLVGEYL